MEKATGKCRGELVGEELVRGTDVAYLPCQYIARWVLRIDRDGRPSKT